MGRAKDFFSMQKKNGYNMTDKDKNDLYNLLDDLEPLETAKTEAANVTQIAKTADHEQLTTEVESERKCADLARARREEADKIELERTEQLLEAKRKRLEREKHALETQKRK